MLNNVKKTKVLLEKHQLRPRKNLGQNFLIDENILNKIVLAARPDPETGVVEIGPGIGALTEALLQNFRKVLAFEIDKKLVGVLKEELAKYSNLKILSQDFLKADLKKSSVFLRLQARHHRQQPSLLHNHADHHPVAGRR